LKIESICDVLASGLVVNRRRVKLE
jgi:hypothetical protein